MTSLRPTAAGSALALLCTAQFLVVLDVTIVNVALPSLQADLGLSTHGLHWAVTAYAIAFGGFLLAGGRAGDLFGRRRTFTAGTALFTVASVACALAPEATTLVAGRALQGLGAALLSPAAFAMIVSAREGRERTAAIAVWGSVGALGAVSGLVLGGVLTELGSWRAVFLINAPIGLAVLALAPLLLRESRPDARRRLGLTGAALGTAGVVLLVYGLERVAGPDGLSPRTAAAGAAAGLLLLAFAGWERHVRDPLLPGAVVRGSGFLAPATVGFLHGATMLGTFLLLPLYLQQARGLSAVEAGLVLLLTRAPAIGWARVAGRLAARFGPGPTMIAGAALMTAALAALTRAPADGSLLVDLAPGLVVFGLAVPCLFVSVGAAALEGVRPDDAGVASGLLSTFQWVGGAIGLAVVAALGSTGGGAAAHGDPAAVVDLVRTGLWGCTALSGAGLAVAVGGQLHRHLTAPATSHA